MGKAKRRSGRFEVEWVTVSYKTILRWLLVALALGLLAGGVYLGFRLEASGERRDVERLLATVDAEVRTARGKQPQGGDELGEADEHLRTARARFESGDLLAARNEAREAREALRRIGGSTDRARFLRIEGQVQVKPVGSLDWANASQGLGLGPGDLVRTGSGAAAQILNLDGSTVTLQADTVLRIERSAKDRVSGKTEVAVLVNSGQLTMATSEMQPPGSTSEVRTAHVSATVERNTVLGVGVEEGGDRARIDVFEGRAHVRSEQSVIEVGQSERLSISPEGLERRKLPGTPQLLTPPQYKLLLTRDLEGGVEIEWESIRDARAYKVELGQTPLFTQQLHAWERHPNNYANVGQLGVGRYYWRVTAIDRDGVEGGPSPAGVFRVSDVEPEGDPPPLRLTNAQSLGEGMFLFEGRTQPGVFLTIDDGSRVHAVQPGQSGEFSKVINVSREGRQTVTITARNSEGLENRIRQPVEVRFQ